MKILLILLSLLFVFAIKVQAQVPEIPNPNLPDIAMVQMTPQGPVIFYNPNICRQAGPALCSFYRKHEYGHVSLGHGYSRAMPQQKEAEADCWAAAHATEAELAAALAWFDRGGGADWHHGSGPQRAARVRACAGTAGPGRGAKDVRCVATCRSERSTCELEGRDGRAQCRRDCDSAACRADCNREATQALNDCRKEYQQCTADCD